MKKIILDQLKPFENTKGIKGTVLEFFMQDFKCFLEKLCAIKEINVTHLHIVPVNDDDLMDLRMRAAYEKIVLDQELISLYSQFSKLQLRWIHKEHPPFDDSDMNFTTEPIELARINSEMGKARFINITAISDFLYKGNEYHLSFKETDGLSLFYFNYNHHFSMQAAFNANVKKGALELYFGDDYYAESWKSKESFTKYMKNILKIDYNTILNASKE